MDHLNLPITVHTRNPALQRACGDAGFMCMRGVTLVSILSGSHDVAASMDEGTLLSLLAGHQRIRSLP